MIETRLKIKYKRDFHLSEQFVLDCNVYSQGCDGGFEYQVLRWLREFYVLPSECKAYTAKTGKCNQPLQCDIKNKKPQMVSVENYRYIGYLYGNSSEEQMMWEIFKNGPITADFEPRHDLSVYKSGVYKPASFKAESQGVLNQNFEEYFKIDHSILIYGWGKMPDGTKYWLI